MTHFTSLAKPTCWLKEVRKMFGLPLVTTSTDSEPLICGMPACRANSMLATVEPL